MSFPKLFLDAQATDIPRVRRALQKIQAWANSLTAGGSAESEVPDINIYTPDLYFNGGTTDGLQGLFVSPDYTWNTNQYTKLMIHDSNVDDIVVFHKSSTDVVVTGSAGAWVITIPNNHIILDANNGDLSQPPPDATADILLQTADLTRKRLITVSPARSTGWLDDAPVSPDVGTFTVLAGWSTGIASTQRILSSSFSSAGLIDADGWARFKITHITIGSGFCRFRSYGAR